MRSELNEFLRYLHIEKGFSQGIIEAYRLDIEKGLIPFLRQRGKVEVGDVTKADIRAYLDYVASSRGNLVPIIEFLRANTEFGSAPAYSPAPALRESQHGEPSTSSEWKLSDFLPALPPHPPLPRGLFKD